MHSYHFTATMDLYYIYKQCIFINAFLVMPYKMLRKLQKMYTIIKADVAYKCVTIQWSVCTNPALFGHFFWEDGVEYWRNEDILFSKNYIFSRLLKIIKHMVIHKLGQDKNEFQSYKELSKKISDVQGVQKKIFLPCLARLLSP